MEEDDLKYNTENTVMKKDNVTYLSLPQPTVMREWDTTMSSLVMSKVLLESLLLRQELRLKNMQENMEDQIQRLGLANKKLKEYEKMISFSWLSFWDKRICLVLEKLLVLEWGRLKQQPAHIMSVKYLIVAIYTMCTNTQVYFSCCLACNSSSVWTLLLRQCKKFHFKFGNAE